MRRRHNGTVRYARYLRCSTDEQADQEYSTTDVQDGLTRKYVVEQGGIDAGVYVDDGYSGTTLKRPGLNRLFLDAQAGKFDRVVVTYLSRLGRADAGTVAEWRLKQDCGVSVDYIREKFTDDAHGRLNKAATRFVDGMYVEQVRTWTLTKMEAMMDNGFVVGQIPFGFDKAIAADAAHMSKPGKEPPKRPILHAEQGRIVRQAFDLFAERGSVAAVRDYLNGVTDRHWTTTSTGNLLRNEAYTGTLIFRDGKWRKEDFYPIIVERAVWQQVHDTLDGRRAIAPPRSDGFNYFLRGILFCPYCNCVYSPSPAKGGAVPYYACLHHQKRKTDCPVKRINADALHFTILQQIEYATKHHTVMHRLIADSGGWEDADDAIKERRASVSRQQQFVGVQIGNITKAIAGGSKSFRSLLTTLEELEEKRSTFERELRRLDAEITQSTLHRATADQVQEHWSQFIELWPELTEDEKREMIGLVVRRIEVKEKDRVFLELATIGGKHGTKFVTNAKWEPTRTPFTHSILNTRLSRCLFRQVDVAASASLGHIRKWS